MTAPRLDKTSENQYRLSGDVDVYTVPSVSTANWFSASGAINIDLSDIEKTDSGTLALMLSWQRRAAKQHTQIVYSNLPKNLSSLMRLYELDSVISISQ